MLDIKMTKRGIAAIGKKNLRKFGRDAVNEGGKHWFHTYLRLHFMNTAYPRYRYRRRQVDVNRLKRAKTIWPYNDGSENRAIGEEKPLVWSGRSRTSALSHYNGKATAQSFENYRCEVPVRAPALNFGVGKRINMRDEVTRFTPQEEGKIQKIFMAEYQRAFENFRGIKKG